MSTSTRIIYNVLACYAGASPSTGSQFDANGNSTIQQLERVQSTTNGWNARRTNILQYGQLGALDRVIIDPLSSELSTSYYVADLSNERKMGFYVSGNSGILANFINKTQDERTYFVAVAPQGTNQIGYVSGTQNQVIQVTNAYVNSYSTEGAVGQVPTTNVSFVGFNWGVSTGYSGGMLAVESTSGTIVPNIYVLPTATSGLANTVSVIRPGEITVNINNDAIGLDTTDFKIQRYQISFDLNRQDLLKMGSKFPYSKEISFPIPFRVAVTAYWGNLITGSINNLFCSDSPYNIQVNLYQPCQLGNPAGLQVNYACNGVKLDTQQLANMSIGDTAATATLTFDGIIGGASAADANSNIFFSGVN